MLRFGQVVFLIVPCSCLLMGCGGSDAPAYHVKGTVTYKGNPLPAGTIQFVPTKDNPGTTGNAKIVNGQYDTSAEGSHGTIGGSQTVIINGFDGKADPANELPLGKQIVKDYKVDYDVPLQSDPAVQDFKIVVSSD